MGSRYRTGPFAGTIVITALAAAGIYGLIAAGFRGQSVGSSIFAVVVISLFTGLAAFNLNDLRGVRTSRRPDGTAVLKIPGYVPARGRWWRTFAAADITSLSLVYVGRRYRTYNLGVSLRDGRKLTCSAITVSPSRRVNVGDTRAGRMVERIRQDLGLDHA